MYALSPEYNVSWKRGIVIRSRDGSERTAIAMALTSRQYSKITSFTSMTEEETTTRPSTFYILRDALIVGGYAVLARGNAAGVARNVGKENLAETK